MRIKIFQVDAFTARPFAGNPAAVCILDEDPPLDWMQNLAGEMNLSETAFLRRNNGEWGLRWFTPNQEVDLCGHATLASAHILWQVGSLSLQAEARFQTRSGLLTARKCGNWIEMDFPGEPPQPDTAPTGLLEALGAEPVYCGRNRFDYLLELDSANQVRQLAPDFSRLRVIDCRGVIVTAPSDSAEYDFVSRFFAPAAAVDEDPVTGSAHCALAPFWAERLGKSEMTGYQASKRGGVVGVEVRGNRVLLKGQAITVLEGSILDWRVAEGDDMESKSSYQKKMRNQVQELGARIDDLLAGLEQRAQDGYKLAAKEVKEKRGVLGERLSALEKSSGEAWQEIKPGLDAAWEDLRQAVERAAKRFRSSGRDDN